MFHPNLISNLPPFLCPPLGNGQTICSHACHRIGCHHCHYLAFLVSTYVLILLTTYLLDHIVYIILVHYFTIQIHSFQVPVITSSLLRPAHSEPSRRVSESFLLQSLFTSASSCKVPNEYILDDWVMRGQCLLGMQ